MLQERCLSKVTIALLAMTGIHATVVEAGRRASEPKSVLQRSYDLGAARTPGTRYFDMSSTFVSFGLDGKRSGSETFRMLLKCVYRGEAGKAGYQYTCKAFTCTTESGSEVVSIPALAGWTYNFKKTETGRDRKGQVFGIDHAKFEGLTDSSGNVLDSSTSYLIYNTFIDFHGFCDEFALPVTEDKGIQHLRRVGEKIVHAAAHTKAPTSLGGNFKEGSYFQNGEITLSFKGLGLIDSASCALIEFDSGEGSFVMIMDAAPGMEVKTVGGSHYFGDIYVDLATRWPRKVDMRELIVSETVVPMPNNAKPMKMHVIHERHSVIEAVTEEAFAGN